MTFSEGTGVVLITYSILIPLLIIIVFRSQMKTAWFCAGNVFQMVSTILAIAITKSFHLLFEKSNLREYASIIIMVFMQELSRYVLYEVVRIIDLVFLNYLKNPMKSSDKSLQDLSSSKRRSSKLSGEALAKNILSFTSAAFFTGIGMGFGQLYQQYLCFTVVIFQPGTVYFETEMEISKYFVLLITILALLRFINQVAWNIIVFKSSENDFKFSVYLILFIHMLMSMLTHGLGFGQGSEQFTVIFCLLVTIFSLIWAFQSAGGSLNQIPCFQNKLNIDYEAKSSSSEFSLRDIYMRKI